MKYKIKNEVKITTKNQNIILEKGDKIRIREGEGYTDLVKSVGDAEYNKLQAKALKFSHDHNWNVASAVLFAYMVMEDANAHEECEAIEKVWERYM